MRLIAWTWLIVPLGITRATQIVLHDKILEKPRAFIDQHGTSYMKYSIGCPWCTSVQLALVTMAFVAWDFTRSFTLWVLAALAVSLIAVVVDRLIDRVAPDPPPEPEQGLTTYEPPTPPAAVASAFRNGRHAAKQ